MREAKPRLELRVAMVMSGKKQYELARLTGLSESAISKIVYNRRQATPREMAKFAEVLGVPKEDLFPEEHKNERTSP